jgi:hypothetical protein
MSDSKDWAELVAEFEAHHSGPRIRTLPVTVACSDPNPWDSDIHCTKPSGHRGLHENCLNGWDWQRWDDGCHFAGDNCDPCSHPGGNAA